MSVKNLSQLTDELIGMIRYEVEADQVRSFLEENKSVDIEYLNRSNHLCSIYVATPLMVASKRHNCAVVALLIEYGADSTVRSDRGKTALHYAIEESGNEAKRFETIKILVENMGQKINIKDVAEKDALIYSIEKGDIETVRLLLENGANVNTSDKYKNSALSLAATTTHPTTIDLIRLLISNGAQINSRDRFGRTPLFYAQTVEAVRELFDNGADLNSRDDNGETVLMRKSHDRDLTKQLLDLNADIFLLDNLGNTALEHSYLKGNKLSSKMLASRFLKHLFDYFNENDSTTIRNNIDMFISTQEDRYFPIKAYHIFSMTLLNINRGGSDKHDSKQDEFLFDEEFFYFLPYFISDDFQEKLWADIINRLDEQSIESDGQLLIGKRFRAKCQNEVNRIDEMLRLFGLKKKMAETFSQLTIMLRLEFRKLTERILISV